MSVNPLAKWGISLPKVPSRAMCEDLLENLILEEITAARPVKFKPSPDRTLRYRAVVTWLTDRRSLSRAERQDCLVELSITAFIGRMAWETLGEPGPEEWRARLQGVHS